MKLILNIYDHGVVMHVKSLPSDCQNSNDFSVLSHNFVSNECNLMKLILCIYDHSVVMQLVFCQGVICNRGVLAL